VLVPEGGVVALSGQVYAQDRATALAGAAIRVLRDGEALAGELSAIPVWTGTLAGQAHEFVVVVWRPAAPLAAGVHVLDLGDRQVSLEVLGALAQPAAQVSRQAASSVLVDGDDVVCCETYESSCGVRHRCAPTLATRAPAIDLAAALDVDDRGQSRLWVARLGPDGAVGPELPRPAPPWGVDRPWTEWDGEVGFADEQDEYCVYLGVTRLVDGATTGAPVCLSADLLAPPVREEQPPPPTVDDEPDGCLTPPVYAEDGAAYPRRPGPPAQGCAVAPPGGWAWLLLVLRRRRPRADRLSGPRSSSAPWR
jgi:hypothetical protein